ncbi:MAG: class I SAM-dependent methyltransferase [Gammaproteobacteria bacterium]|nr:MAG: class I SAM-dependent methyltransferase [Gammaproteobacteria bacterium]
MERSSSSTGGSGVQALGPGSPAGSASRAALRWLWRAMDEPPVAVRLADGEHLAGPPPAEAVGSLRLQDGATLRRLLLHPELRFGDLYSTGELEVEGELPAVLEALYHGLEALQRSHGWLRRLAYALTRPHGSGLRQARDNIHRHYDLGNSFYRLWLDEQLLYTCAYFPTPEASLEEAQVAKMDHVCRKLRLRPGERVVEAGCGWGALALHMARAYGVRVRAYNISREQLAWARERARREGLEGRVEFVDGDWREIQGRYDAFVSVGMLEHVGRERYGELAALLDRCLEPHGRGLIHSIGRNAYEPFNAWIERRIFPGAYPPTLTEMLGILEPHRFSVLDVENLRLHYERTLAHWLERYERAAERVEAMFDTRFLRAWRLYLAGSMVAFRTGSLQLFQVLFARPGLNRIPWTRAHLYGAA